MRGVLLPEELQTQACIALFTADLTVLVDDGHAWPYAAGFLWPDESPGMVIRLEEDEFGLPTLLELTHVAAGRKINLPFPASGFFRRIVNSVNANPVIGYIKNETTGKYHSLTAKGAERAQIKLGPQVELIPNAGESVTVLFPEFSTVSAMKISPETAWKMATCLNLDVDDGNFSQWVKTSETGLDGTDPAIAELSDGTFARRLYP
jgi:hypothetical protein